VDGSSWRGEKSAQAEIFRDNFIKAIGFEG
jgi:hypothetical protein